MRLLHLLPSMALGAALILQPTAAWAEPAFALDSRNLLLRFDTNSPGFVESTQVIRGLAPGESILGIDFRPANGTTASVPGSAGPFNPAPQLRPGRAVQVRPQEPPR